MSEHTPTAIPNPGTPEAAALFCCCAILDNAYGRGYMGQPGVFVYTDGCPLHRRTDRAEQSNA